MNANLILYFCFFQLSENSSLLSAEDTVSERVRFDDNISFIDDTATASASLSTEPNVDSAVDNTSLSGRLINKVNTNTIFLYYKCCGLSRFRYSLNLRQAKQSESQIQNSAFLYVGLSHSVK